MESTKELNFQILTNLTRYRIYNNGTIFDLKNNRYVKTQKNKDGYLKCTLRYDNGKRKTFSAHQLVALAFIQNEENKSEVNHKDGNKENNELYNLEWCTHAENIKHAWDNNLIKNTQERSKKISMQNKRIGNDNHKSKPVILKNTGEIFESGNIAANAYGVRQEQLNRCCNPNHTAKFAGRHPLTKEPLIWEYYNKEEKLYE